MAETDTLLSVNDAAKALGVSRRTLYTYFSNGTVAFVQLGGRKKVAQSEIDRVKGGTP